MRYFIEINKSGDAHSALIHQGNPADAAELQVLDLGPQAEVEIKGDTFQLQALNQALIGYHENDLGLAFDARGQREIGQHLFDQTIGRLGEADFTRLRGSADVEIRVITDDEHIARLPWILMADKKIFLSNEGWSISLSSRRETVDAELPPSPKMLVAAPQPAGESGTDADSHLEELENMLSAGDHLLRRGRKLKVVRKWEEFIRTVDSFKPDVLYYCGHGTGDIHSAKLIFETGSANERKFVPVTDFAQILRNMKRAPCVAYINCCLGDAAGFLGVGNQLGNFIPAVITNRTVAEIKAAQSQALKIWEKVLLKGASPHRAIDDLYRHFAEMGMSAEDILWMTPVLYTGYDRWTCHPPTPVSRPDRDPYWPLKVDRITQFHTLSGLTQQMLRERKPKSLAFVWFGKGGHGIDLFHKRIPIELREIMTNTEIYQVSPEWPPALDNISRAFKAEYAGAFEVHFRDIPTQIRLQSKGASGKQVLVYVRHRPVTSRKQLKPKQLREYLQWWDAEFVSLLEPHQYALLGISFIVKTPVTFNNETLTKEVDIYSLYGTDTMYHVLGELGEIERKDILDFIRTHRLRIPNTRIDDAVKRVMDETDGHYEKVIEKLRTIEDEVWDDAEEPEKPVEDFEEDEEY